MDNIENKKPPRQFNLDSFKKAKERMISKNNGAYKGYDFLWHRLNRTREYTIEQVEAILKSDNINEQRDLSRTFFNGNGFYRQILLHYGTLLKNMGILIPNPAFGISLQDNPIAKRYYGALNLVELMKLPEILTRISISVLVDGTYYGLISTLNKSTFVLMDLPFEYCRSEYRDENGQDMIEFDVRYFLKIVDENIRKEALKIYPKVIVNYYKSWERNQNKDPWIFIPSDIAVSFQLFDGRPYFLPLIPGTIQYDEAVENEANRAAEEIKKLVVQKIPHLNDGTLLFEPIEVQEMHDGAVGMLKTANPNISVLTTYGDVDVIQSKTTDSITHTALEQMSSHVYAVAGVSPHIFAASGAAALETSLRYDTSLMMILGNKYSSFISRVLNRVYGNGQINFKYNLLSITHHNEQDFISDSFKLAQSGYSFLLPSIAQGISQRDLINLKTLENDLLKMQDKLIPLQSAYTQSGGEEDQTGRPSLDPDKKSDKTTANEDSKNKTGG